MLSISLRGRRVNDLRPGPVRLLGGSHDETSGVVSGMGLEAPKSFEEH